MATKKKAVFAGSFDPFTKAHQRICCEASVFFDITILICTNPAKKYGMFGPLMRKMIIDSMLDEDEKKSIKVEVWDGLLYDYCNRNDIEYLIRGLRYTNGPEEMELASLHAMDGIQTVLFPICDPKLMHLSSTLVREYIRCNDTSWYQMVPKGSIDIINDIIESNKRTNQ